MSLYSRDGFELKVFKNSRTKRNRAFPFLPENKRLKILTKAVFSTRRKETLTREEL